MFEQSVGFFFQDEAVEVARAVPRGAHYHADVIYLLLKVTGCSSRKPPAMSRSAQIKMARLPKTPGELKRRIGTESVRTIRQERVVFVVCTAGAFLGCVDNVKSE